MRFQPRKYQEEALSAALGDLGTTAEGGQPQGKKNLVLVLPTNSGKTWVAGQLIQWYLRNVDDKKIIFLAPTGPLVQQQAQELAQMCNLCDTDDFGDANEKELEEKQELPECVTAVYGGLSETSRARSKRSRVIVSTPALMIKDLQHAEIKMKDVALLILDEAHHSVGKDHYSIIMKCFYLCEPPHQRPHVLALTASPFKFKKLSPTTERGLEAELLGDGGQDQQDPREKRKQQIAEHLANMEKVLDCDTWFRNVSKELPQTNEEHKEFPLVEPTTRAKNLGKALKAIAHACRPADSLCKPYATILERLQELTESLGVWGAARFLEVYSEAWSRRVDLDEKIRELWPEEGDDDSPSSTSIKKKELEACQQALQLCHHKLKAWQTTDDVTHMLESPQDYASAKLKKLQALLEEAMGTDPTQRKAQKILVFARMRVVNQVLREFFEMIPSFRGSVAHISSTRQSKITRMRESEQRANLKAFRAECDGKNILFSTAVLGEGINIQACNLVIMFDEPQSVLENIQMRGRARRRGASFVHIICSGDETHKQRLRDFAETEEDIGKVIEEKRHVLARSREPTQQRLERDADRLLVESTGAKLPKERATEFLNKVYVMYRPPHDGANEEYIELSMEPFKKDNYQVKDLFLLSDEEKREVVAAHGSGCLEARRYVGSVTLPRVGCCSVPMSKVKVWGLPTMKSEEAKMNAALEASRHLHRIGVLNDQLYVEGRAELLKKHLADSKTWTLEKEDDKWALATTDHAVRKLPACIAENFRRMPEAEGGGYRVYAYTFTWHHDDSSTSPVPSCGNLALLLPRPMPEASMSLVVNYDKNWQMRLQEAPSAVSTLSEEEFIQLKRWSQLGLEVAGVDKTCTNRAAKIMKLVPLWGTYAHEAAQAAGAETKTEEAHWILAPLCGDGDGCRIHWPLVKWGLRCMERPPDKVTPKYEFVTLDRLGPCLEASMQRHQHEDSGESDNPLVTIGEELECHLGDLTVLGLDLDVRKRMLQQRHCCYVRLRLAKKLQEGASPNWEEDEKDDDEEATDTSIGVEEQTSSIYITGQRCTRKTASTGSSGGTKEFVQEKEVSVPADECQILPLLYGHLRAVQTLPGVLWRLEHIAVAAEVAQQLQPTLGIRLPVSMQVQILTHSGAVCLPLSLTADQAPVPFNYERLEFLGDAILKLLSCIQACQDKGNVGPNQLSVAANRWQRNRYLYERSHCYEEEFGVKLLQVMLVRPFEDKLPLPKQRKHEVQVKMQADVIEAFLGATFEVIRGQSPFRPLDEGLEQAQRCFQKLVLNESEFSSHGQDSDGDTGFCGLLLSMTARRFKVNAQAQPSDLTSNGHSATKVSGLEYEFCNGHLLKHICMRNGGGTNEDKIIFEELEYLGDALLQALVSTHLMDILPAADEGSLSQARAALVCNHWLASCLVRRCKDLGLFLDNSNGKTAIAKTFAAKALEKDEENVWIEDNLIVGPTQDEDMKFIGDIYEALVAAVFVDCQCDLTVTWDVFKADFIHVDAALLLDRVEKERARCRKETLAMPPEGSGTAHPPSPPCEASSSSTTATSTVATPAPSPSARQQSRPERELVVAPAQATSSTTPAATPAASPTTTQQIQPERELDTTPAQVQQEEDADTLRESGWCPWCQSEIMIAGQPSHFQQCFENLRQRRKWNDAYSCLTFLQQKTKYAMKVRETQEENCGSLRYTIEVYRSGKPVVKGEGQGSGKKTAKAKAATDVVGKLQQRGLP